MGMSAGQARLLSITTRLTNNEFRAQTITNSKLRLAEKSSQASQEYMDALETKQLMFGTFDSNGAKTYTALTPNMLLTFSDLKNQYAMVNSAGKIMVSGIDAKNYAKSNTLEQFLNCYDITKVYNTSGTVLANAFIEAGSGCLQAALQADSDNNYNPQCYMHVLAALLGTNTASISPALKDGEKSPSGYYQHTNETSATLSHAYIDANAIGLGEEYTTTTGAFVRNATKKVTTNENVKLTINSKIFQLSDSKAIQFDENGTILFDTNCPDYNSDVQELIDAGVISGNKEDGFKFTGLGAIYTDNSNSTDNKMNLTNYSYIGANGYINSIDSESGQSTDTVKSLAIDSSGNMFIAYCIQEVEQYGNEDKYPNSHTKVIYNAPIGMKYNVPIYSKTTYEYDKLGHQTKKTTTSDLGSAAPPKYIQSRKNGTIYLSTHINGADIQRKDNLAKMAEISEYLWGNNGKNVLCPDNDPDMTAEKWLQLNDCQKLMSNYVVASGALVQKTFKQKIIDLYYLCEGLPNNTSGNANGEITNKDKWLDDDENPMVTWLEVRAQLENFNNDLISVLNSEAMVETDPAYQWYVNLWYRMGGTSETTKGQDQFKEIDSNLLNSSEWLEFALEQGMITLELAQFTATGSQQYPGMGTFDWSPIVYTNATDIVSQDDEIAVARAEVKYKNTLTEIDNKDKKYEQDLKKLDTEHTALQTEYESVKEVISKNVERSFKAFS